MVVIDFNCRLDFSLSVPSKEGKADVLWQNRFFSCVVENDHYLWSVARYIERNRLKVELAATAEFVRDEDEEGDNANHRATRTGRPYGTDQFIDQLKFLLNQQLRPGKPGRPPKTGKCP